MLSLEELLCCVDDFCQKFEPQWRQQLLANGLQHGPRERNLCLSFHHDNTDCLPSVLLSEFQGILPGFGSSERGTQPFRARESYQRFALVYTLCTVTLVCLPP